MRPRSRCAGHACTRLPCSDRHCACAGAQRPLRSKAAALVLTQALLAAVHEEGEEAVREARRKEEERLSENKRVADILAENEQLVAAEAKRRDEEERCATAMPRPSARWHSPVSPRLPAPRRRLQAKSTATTTRDAVAFHRCKIEGDTIPTLGRGSKDKTYADTLVSNPTRGPPWGPL